MFLLVDKQMVGAVMVPEFLLLGGFGRFLGKDYDHRKIQSMSRMHCMLDIDCLIVYHVCIVEIRECLSLKWCATCHELQPQLKLQQLMWSTHDI